MIIPQLDPQVRSQTTTIVKNIFLSSGSCLHTNSVKILLVQNIRGQDQPKIKTSIQQSTRNCIKNLTEINYLNKRYIIQDLYQFTLAESSDTAPARQSRSFISQSHDSKNSSQSHSDSNKKSKTIKPKKIRKICFFQKSAKQGHIYRKRNTKNIPKNFCKAFSNFMEQSPNKLTDEWNLAMKNLRKLQKRQKYNNITMKKILQNQTILPFFKDFLVNYAEEWINKSKIADKKVHLEAIAIYLQLIDKLAYAQADPSPSDE